VSNGYNGWKNYETWVVALWIDNEPATYERRREMAQDAWDRAEATKHWTRIESARYGLAADLQEWVVDEIVGDPLGPSLASDLLGAALSEVDWDEIATAWVDEVNEDEDED
jgi:hypothetical protein